MVKANINQPPRPGDISGTPMFAKVIAAAKGPGAKRQFRNHRPRSAQLAGFHCSPLLHELAN